MKIGELNAYLRIWLDEVSCVDLSNSSKVETMDSDTIDSTLLADDSRAHSL